MEMNYACGHSDLGAKRSWETAVAQGAFLAMHAFPLSVLIVLVNLFFTSVMLGYLHCVL